MQVIIHANKNQQEALIAGGQKNDLAIKWVNDIGDFLSFKTAGIFLDLLYIHTKERNELLQGLLPKPVIINAVTDQIKKINYPFIRINGWPGFLDNQIIEAFCGDEKSKANVEILFDRFGKKVKWCKDTPGFVSARVIAMIINEAWLALQEGIAGKEEIDTAMKLGTGYPLGPFEWGEKIGKQNILSLLDQMALTDKKYTPSSLLKREALL